MAKPRLSLIPGLALLDRLAAAPARPTAALAGLNSRGSVPQPLSPAAAAGVARTPLQASLVGSHLQGSKTEPRTATTLAALPIRTGEGSRFTRLAPASFSDGIWAMPEGLPNARTISNLVVAGQGVKANREGLSGMMYAWGQFIDHDLTLTLPDNSTSIAIEVPANDPVLSGVIPMTRVEIDPLTGQAGKPAVAINHVTGWLDGSMVYGSDASTMASLRDANGYLLTSEGRNLPIKANGFQAGDIRVQENPDLTSLHVLFVREHNRLVDNLKAIHPLWSGDQLFEQARRMVIAEIASITYQEFLPHLLGKGAINPYNGYRAGVDASLSAEFSGAAFRLGHSIVSNELAKINEQGETIGTAISLKDAFFQSTTDFKADGGADALLRHLGADLANELDVHLIDDLRNFLAIPGASFDLAAINIQRGRDLGLASLNDTRKALGLKAYTRFNQITADQATAAALKAAYGTVDKVELWIGGLAENHLKGAMLGQTFATIIGRQFQALREGDPLWYQNQGLDPATVKQIQSTSLSQLILRNTDTQHIQEDVFVFTERRAGQLGGGVMENPNAAQLVVGAGDGDVIIGGNANDLLVAGSGRQTMTGGLGADRFIIAHHDASVATIQATITDFRPGQDRLQFEGLRAPAGMASPVQIHGNPFNTRLTFDGGSVLLQGVASDHFRVADMTILA